MTEKAQIAFKRMLVGIWSFKPEGQGSEGVRNVFMEIGNIFSHIRKLSRGDFPGCTVIKNQSSKAEDTGSIPGQEIRSHMPQGNYTYEPRLVKPHAETKTQHSQKYINRF